MIGKLDHKKKINEYMHGRNDTRNNTKTQNTKIRSKNTHKKKTDIKGIN